MHLDCTLDVYAVLDSCVICTLLFRFFQHKRKHNIYQARNQGSQAQGKSMLKRFWDMSKTPIEDDSHQSRTGCSIRFSLHRVQIIHEVAFWYASFMLLQISVITFLVCFSIYFVILLRRIVMLLYTSTQRIFPTEFFFLV